MDTSNSLVYECEYSTNSMLYEFMATNYEISDLASIIHAAENVQISILNLKQRFR